jgi:hypothetical protein
MTDRELLELAAKAAGIEIAWHKWVIDPKATGGCCFALVGTYTYWNPLTDDGDALRLAVKLGLTITSNYHVEQERAGGNSFYGWKTPKTPCAATRRAIVSAAAEIGRQMK